MNERKPTFASVTTEPCKCGWLDREANDPRVPVIYDEEMHEYQFRYETPSRGQLVIYHCPFCGGCAPESHRGSRFAIVQSPEQTRLFAMTQMIKTFEDAVRVLGKPDHDYPAGMTTGTPSSPDKPSEIRGYRTMWYSNLSETAHVLVTATSSGCVEVTLMGKYLGKQK